MKWLAGIIIALLLPATALATTEFNKAIARVGVQGGQAYILFAAPPTAGCLYNDIYFDTSTDQGKASLSLALTARATNTPISRVDYTLNSNGTCSLDLIEM